MARHDARWHVLGRILIVNIPVTVTIQHAVLLSVGVGDLITLLGAPSWMWRTNNLLKGNVVIPATTDHPGVALEDGVLLLLGLVQVSRLLPPGPWTQTRWINCRHPCHLGNEQMMPTTAMTMTTTITRMLMMTPIMRTRTRIRTLMACQCVGGAKERA